MGLSDQGVDMDGEGLSDRAVTAVRPSGGWRVGLSDREVDGEWAVRPSGGRGVGLSDRRVERKWGCQTEWWTGTGNRTGAMVTGTGPVTATGLVGDGPK